VEAEDNSAKSVKVSDIKVNGESATADVAVTGSALNEQSVEVELANEGGDWKLNKFLGFSHFDAHALGDAIEAELEKEEGVSASLAKCVAGGVSKLSQEEAESVAFEKNLETIEEIVSGCE
jgi:hypothetical protein